MTRTRPSPLSLALLLLPIALQIGCATRNIPNTRVEDNSQNREIVEFMEVYRNAVQDRDIAALLRMASPNYFDDMGTPSGDDDVDYETLKAGLQRLRNEVIAARYQISYRGLTYIHDGKVLVDVLYTGWFKVDTPEGPQWRRRLEPHRIVLAREGEQLRILSGM
ncbi:MAG: hypothetical protein OXT09_02740 [Myxococcales bacterium]|nr:hypothetical protein [Myxococcales bacterium]